MLNTCCLQLPNFSKIHPCSTIDTTKLLIYSLFILHLEYCNSLSVCLSLHRLFPLQSILSSATRLIQNTKCSMSTAPSYITNLIRKHHPNYPLCSLSSTSPPSIFDSSASTILWSYLLQSNLLSPTLSVVIPGTPGSPASHIDKSTTVFYFTKGKQNILFAAQNQ